MLKILTSGALAVSLGLSLIGFGHDENAPSTDAAALDCVPACMEDCDATVERLPDGTCRIHCVDENGEACWAIVACAPGGACEVLESSANCELSDCAASQASSSSACDEKAARAGCAATNE